MIVQCLTVGYTIQNNNKTNLICTLIISPMLDIPFKTIIKPTIELYTI